MSSHSLALTGPLASQKTIEKCIHLDACVALLQCSLAGVGGDASAISSLIEWVSDKIIPFVCSEGDGGPSREKHDFSQQLLFSMPVSVQ